MPLSPFSSFRNKEKKKGDPSDSLSTTEIEEVRKQLESQSLSDKLSAVIRVRKLLSKPDKCPTKEVFASGIVPQIVDLISEKSDQVLLVSFRFSPSPGNRANHCGA